VSTPIHGLNLNVPDNTYNTWTLTNTQPGTWANATFGIGTSHVYGTIYFGAWNHSKGQQVESQSKYAQGSLSFYPALNVKVDDVLGTKVRLHLAVGGVGGRYGTAGKYDSGPYGTPIVGAVFGVGEQLGLERDFGDFTLRLEEGFGGNDHPTSDVRGSTFFAHTHLMGSYKDAIKGGIHYMTSFTQDDRGTKGLDPDGSISLVGADVRFNGGIYGELFLGGSYVKMKHAAHVDGSIQVAHIAGGQGMMDNFLGTDRTRNDFGTGSLKNFLVQYDYSFGTLARYPENFWGDGPDLKVTLFGLFTQVGSADADWDNIKKLKFGADVSYFPISWFGVGLRGDRVIPSLETDENSKDGAAKEPGQNFSVLSPRLIFHSSFVSHETVGIQYSRYFYPSDGARGLPQIPKETLLPKNTTNIEHPLDTDVFSIKATMWF
jgi:hypothetical protein